MVMIFVDPKPRNFLLNEGLVYTFRVKRRKKLGNDWLTDKRGGRKIANIIVLEMLEIQPEDLSSFVGWSGFSTLEEWHEAIKRINGFIPSKGWLYLVLLSEMGNI